MKKAVYHGIRDVRVEEVEEPRPGPNQAKVKVKYCGICGSDLHEYLHGPFPESPFGHEVIGEIVELGEGLEGFQEGDRVLAIRRDGYAEYSVAPKEKLLKVPDEIPWKRGVVIEPLAGAAYAIEKGGVRPEDTVLITGAGPVGLMLLMGLKGLGVKTVYITELSEQRREMALRLGATATFNPLETRIPMKMRELTNGRGLDVSIEAVGIEASLKDCLASTRYQGKVIVQGIFTERVPIHMLGFVSREMTMIGTNSNNMPLGLKWVMEKGLEPESIITSIIPLEDIVADGFEKLAKEKPEEIKILIEP